MAGASSVPLTMTGISWNTANKVTNLLFLRQSSLSLFLQREDGEVEEDADERHEQTADGACCQGEPEGFYCAYQEGDEA